MKATFKSFCNYKQNSRTEDVTKNTSSPLKIEMEGTCNECVFPLTKEETESEGICSTDTSLTYAASKGKLSCVKELIAAGADVNTACECHGNGPLISAAMEGRVDCLRELVAVGADVNVQNKDGNTALIFAADTECLIELITSGVHLNIKNNNQETALVIATKTGNVDRTEILISAGAEMSAEDHQMLLINECLKELIPAEVNQRNIDGKAALSTFIANLQGNLNNIKQSIELGSNVNDWYDVSAILPVLGEEYATKKFHATPLMIFSAFHGHDDYLKELIAAGAEVNKQREDGVTALMFAARPGHVECLKELIAAGADINKEDNGGRTALHSAAYKGNVECLKELIAAGAEINKGDNNYRTPLMHAADEGYDKCLKVLIAAGADINKQENNGRTALWITANHDHVECLKELIVAGAELNQGDTTCGLTALMIAAAYGHIECLKELIAAGADITKEDKDGRTDLIFAAYHGHIECLKELTAEGAEINKEDKDGRTALIFASDQGRIKCLKELIAAGAEINKQDKDGHTALMCAAHYGHIQCLQELITTGAEVNKQNKNKTAALHLACTSGHVECLKELLKAGADKDMTNASGSTPLLSIIMAGTEGPMHHGHIDCVKELIDAGADVNFQNPQEQGTALHAAVSAGHADIVKILLTADCETAPQNTSAIHDSDYVEESTEPSISEVISGKAVLAKELLKSSADVNAKDEYGNTPLMTAITAGTKPIFLLLLNHGADVNAENDKGETALYLAVTQSHVEYNRMQSKDQNKQNTFLNEDFAPEGLLLMVYMLLRKGAHLHETKSGLNPCTVHLTSAELLNPNPTVLNMLHAGGAKGKNKNNSFVNLLKDCAQDFIREHLTQAHPERNLYFTVPQLGLPKRLQSSLLFHAVQKHNLVPSREEKT